LLVRDCVIDGEVSRLDEEGRSSFQLLQALEMEGRKAPLRFYVFDLLQLDGKVCSACARTTQANPRPSCENAGDPIRYSGEISGDVKSLLAEVKRRSLEGLIAKQRKSVYEPGRRSGTWIKLKCLNEQEFVMAATRRPAALANTSVRFSLATTKTKQKKETVVSNLPAKSEAVSRQRLCRSCPRDFAKKNATNVRLSICRRNKAMTGSRNHALDDEKNALVNPKFVAQIKFAEWTRDGKLRQPVFLGMREDKEATKVRREAA